MIPKESQKVQNNGIFTLPAHNHTIAHDKTKTKTSLKSLRQLSTIMITITIVVGIEVKENHARNTR